MGLKDWWRGVTGTGGEEILEKAGNAPARLPERTGYEYGIPDAGLTECNQRMGAATGTDRRTMLTQLREAYLACTWSWSAINAVARTVTAGGLITDWDGDDNDGTKDIPDKPAEVLNLERMLAYCNPQEDIRQILRGVITDLLVFGDAFLEVVRVGRQPVALYSLDAPSMFPTADAHGQITGYVQVTELGQRAEFDPEDVIHISLDSPQSSIFGVSPTQAALLPIMGWLFASGTTKELFKRGNPSEIHVDMPAGTSPSDVNRWVAQYMTRNVGSRNIGTPVMTRGGATVNELNSSRTIDYLAYIDQKRDEILACYGVPPAKVGVIESGNLGGGTGEAQDRTFMVNTVQPLGELVLEKLNWHLARLGFGVTGWKLKFGEVDMRDSETVEKIRDIRVRNGSWTLNRYRTEIGEPPVDGGNDSVLIDRENLVRWDDIDALSKANVANKLRGTALEPGDPVPGEPLALEKPEPQPVPAALQLAPPGNPDGSDPARPDDTTVPTPPRPGDKDEDEEDPQEAWRAAYRQRLAEALATLPAAA
ncbi:hypothetical protein KCMC57_63860 (plasmid) [Kitasatospora sp. CMC57]|uniref:Phage portal protein n=1 Tax=Kitasatospora sp. CMC57 TaxID=3231513 RepID=A0AB33K8M0_9ACTN